MANTPKPEVRPRSMSFYVLLGAALFVFIERFSLLSPILLSFLLILLISFAVNPVITRMRAWTGGRKVADRTCGGRVCCGHRLNWLGLSCPAEDLYRKNHG